MKTRKLFTRAIAVVACLLMFSTNVLAATVSIVPSENEGVLQVTLTAEAGDLVTFLAVDADTNIAAIAGNAENASKVRAIDQRKADAEGKVVVNVPYIEGANEKIDLYANSNGEAPTFNSLADVRVVASAELVDIPDGDTIPYPVYKTAITNETASPENLKAFFVEQGGVKVKYYPVGMTATEETAVETTVCNPGTKNNFTFELSEFPSMNGEGYFDIIVTYEGVQTAEPIILQEPNCPDSVTLTNAGSENIYQAYYDEEGPFSRDDIISAITKNDGNNIGATAIYDGREPTDVLSQLEFTLTDEPAGEGYTHVYKASIVGIDATDKIYINDNGLRAITGATATTETIVGDVPRGELAGIDTIAEIQQYITLTKETVDFKFTWNDAKKLVTREDLEGMTFSPENLTPTESGDGYKVFDITATKGGWPATFKVKLQESDAFKITGTVRATDATDQVVNFADAIPVGAVVTAIPYNVSGMANYVGTGYNAISTIVDASGNFELELIKDQRYMVVISHTKFVIDENGTLRISNTVLDSDPVSGSVRDITMDASKNLGTINLKYTYFGDADADGRIDNVDADFIRGKFSSAINAE